MLLGRVVAPACAELPDVGSRDSRATSFADGIGHLFRVVLGASTRMNRREEARELLRQRWCKRLDHCDLCASWSLVDLHRHVLGTLPHIYSTVPLWPTEVNEFRQPSPFQ